jgi:hypothetical protein
MLYALLSAVAVCVLVAAVELGRWLGTRQRRANPAGGDAAVGAMDGVVFGLFGLLLAFTFFGAATRFDHRRDLVVTEANAIETAYRRLALLPADAQPRLRWLFRTYVESRVASYAKLPDRDAFQAEYDRSIGLQTEIWNATLAAAQRTSPSPVGMIVGPLNDMTTVTRTRTAAMRFHVPPPILCMLFGVAVAASVLGGRNLSANPRRSWVNVVAFALVVAGSIYMILDYEYPRVGLIRTDPADRLLVELLDSIRETSTPPASPPAARSPAPARAD